MSSIEIFATGFAIGFSVTVLMLWAGFRIVDRLSA